MSTDPLSPNKIIYELKERAKWSDDRQEKKTAIKQLSAFGSAAVPALEEIFYVTAYDEIRVACTDAIDTIKSAGKTETITKRESAAA